MINTSNCQHNQNMSSAPFYNSCMKNKNIWIEKTEKVNSKYSLSLLEIIPMHLQNYLLKYIFFKNYASLCTHSSTQYN